MTDAPYLIAMALLEQGGSRALPLQGTGLRAPLPAGADPGEAGERQALELLLRVWQRSEEGPLRRAAGEPSLLLVTVPIEALQQELPALKAAWIQGGSTEALLQGLRELGSGLWSLSVEPRQPLRFTSLA